MLCMGSSLRVTPASELPEQTLENGGKYVIINLQKTPADDEAALVIHGHIDKVITMLMEKLRVPIPEFRRSYRLQLSYDRQDRAILASGVDPNGTCYTIFRSLVFKGLPDSANFMFPKSSDQV